MGCVVEFPFTNRFFRLPPNDALQPGQRVRILRGRMTDRVGTISRRDRSTVNGAIHYSILVDGMTLVAHPDAIEPEFDFPPEAA